MPMVAAGAVVAGFATGAATAIGVFSWTAFAGSLILGGLSYALTPKPKSSGSSLGQAQPGTVAVRQSDLTRSICYGHTRVVRGYAHMVSTNSNKDLHLILMLCQGELREINEIWVNDYCVPNDAIDANGKVISGRYKDNLTIRKHTGATNQIADSLAVANIPDWTTTDRLQGIAYLYVIMNKNQDIYPTGVPNITAVVEGPSLYDPRVSAQRWSCNMALFAFDYLTSAYYGYGTLFDDIDLTNIAAQANICDEIVAVTHEAWAANAVDAATDIISLTFEGDLLTLQFGDQVQVSTTGTLPAGLSVATNYYVIPYQIKDNPRILLATSFQNAMAKTAINLTTAGTGVMTVTKFGEPRYNGSGTLDTEKNLSDNMSDFATCMAGRAIDIAGRWTLLAGAWRAPAVTFGIDDLRNAGIGGSNGQSISESFNLVKGTFNGAPTLYQDTDYPAATYPQFVTDDGGIPATKNLNLPYIGRPTTAQRIAKIELFRGRQGMAFNSDFSMKALRVQPGDVDAMTIDYLGWNAKPFEITRLTFDISENGLFIKMDQRETAQEIYDWSAGEAIYYDPAPNSDLPNPFDVLALTGLSYNSRIIDTVQGDQVATLQLEWVQHPDAFVREYGQIELEAKLSSAITFLPGFKVSGNLTKTDVVTASIGVLYDLRARAINNLGVRSEWAYLYEVMVGSSGGITVNDDWGSVAASPGFFKDWGTVNTAATLFEDWGFAF